MIKNNKYYLNGIQLRPKIMILKVDISIDNALRQRYPLKYRKVFSRARIGKFPNSKNGVALTLSSQVFS